MAGVRQDCLLSHYIFLLVVDWFIKTSASEEKHRIQWTARNQLEDLDFAYDLVLLSHTHGRMQVKTNSVAAASASVGLSIYKRERKILKYNTENIEPLTFDRETMEEVESFTYLGSIIDERGVSDRNLKARIVRARTAFLQSINIWNSEQLSVNIKVIIFGKNIQAGTWRTTTSIIKKYKYL
ncbi:unnamed protein product [Schistosoma curassoni]|uniref:Reverse transcriptase domain-containing protein n=1 Tax=Schistosoma curassoni TaxID=6186 RepID=A0A183JGT8_9TREM|nr:unnamed protein product [Schistosoma curassoni]